MMFGQMQTQACRKQLVLAGLILSLPLSIPVHAEPTSTPSGEILLKHFGELTAYSPQERSERQLIVGRNIEVEDAAYSPNDRSIALITREKTELAALPYPHTVMNERHRLCLFDRQQGDLKAIADVPDYYAYSTRPRIRWFADGTAITVDYSKASVTLPPDGGVWYGIAAEVSATYDLSGTRLSYQEQETQDRMTFPTPNATPPQAMPISTVRSLDGQWEAFADFQFPSTPSGAPDRSGQSTLAFFARPLGGKQPTQIFSRSVPPDRSNLEHKIIQGHGQYLFVFQCDRDLYGVTPDLSAVHVGTLPELDVFLDYSSQATTLPADQPVQLRGLDPAEAPFSHDLIAQIDESKKILAMPPESPAQDAQALERALDLQWGLVSTDRTLWGERSRPVTDPTNPQAQELQAIVSDRLPLIAQHLRHPKPEIRRSAVALLGKMQYDAAFDQMVQLIDDPDASVQESAISALGALEDRRAVPILLQQLNAETENRRARAAEALGRIQDRSSTEDLLRALANDSSSYVRDEAAKALIAIGEYPILDALEEALRRETDQGVRRRIGEAIAPIRHYSQAALSSRDFAQATYRDISMKTEEEAAATPLEAKIQRMLQELHNPRVKIQEEAGNALGCFASAPAFADRRPDLINQLLALLKDEDLNTRWSAFHTLLGLVDDSSVALLRNALGNESDVFAIRRTLYLLGELRTEEAQSVLRGYLAHHDPEVRTEASRALAGWPHDQESH